MQLSDPLLPTSIAHSVYKGVLSERRRGRTLAYANMPCRHEDNLGRLQNLGIAPPPESVPHYHVAMEAGLYGDRIALQQWQHESRVASGVPDAPRGDRPRRGVAAAAQLFVPSLRLPRPLPLNHAADIYFNFSQQIGVGPLRHGLVPLSYLGPGGTSIPALSNRQHDQVSVVARLHTGSSALRRHPWRPRNPVRTPVHTGTGAPGADTEFSDDDTVASESSSDGAASVASDEESNADTDSMCSSSDSRASMPPPGGVTAAAARARPSSHIPSTRQLAIPRSTEKASLKYTPGHDGPRAAVLNCRFCASGHEHPAHVFFECPSGNLTALRASMLADAAAAWGRLLSRIEEAVLSEYNESVPAIDDARAALAQAYGAADPAEAHWLTYRLLWAIPWPAEAAPANARAARAIGTIFDETILSRHASRPLADTWIAWSSRLTKRFGAEWARLLQDHRPDADSDRRSDITDVMTASEHSSSASSALPCINHDSDPSLPDSPLGYSPEREPSPAAPGPQESPE